MTHDKLSYIILVSVKRGDKVPTATFLNLNIEKRQRLIEAAVEEFTTELFTNASINRIIKKSKIPRGSFYMYFSNKEDLYFYLLETFKEEHINKIEGFLKDSKGDIIVAFQKAFTFVTNSILDNNKSFFRNFILNMNYLMENKLFFKYHKERKEREVSILKHINNENLNIQNEEDIFNMLSIIMSLFIHKLIEIIKYPEYKEEITNKYIKQLKLLGTGFYKIKN